MFVQHLSAAQRIPTKVNPSKYFLGNNPLATVRFICRQFDLILANVPLYINIISKSGIVLKIKD